MAAVTASSSAPAVRRPGQAVIARLAATCRGDGSAGTISPRAPYTGEALAELPVATLADVDAAFTAAHIAASEWAARSHAERAGVLLRAHELILDRQAEVLDLVQWENGKARKHAFEEVADIAITLRHYARKGRSYLRPRRRLGAIPVLTQAVEHHHPKGVVGVISPWNYPLSLGLGDNIPALLAGNGIVQKPDSQTPLTALWARELMIEAGLPRELWQIVLGPGSTIGTAIVERADYVCFTGSTATGRIVARGAAERLVGASLELGGKNPMLVLADADLDRAAEGAIRACFASTGQLCISIERLLIHSSVYDEFLDEFVRRTRALRLGAALDYTPDLGSLVSPAQLKAVTDHVEDAVSKGAHVLAGGRARPDIGPLFYEPTVLSGVTESMAACRDETFGPVVSVYSFDDEEEAIARANDTSYGLNASVWTRDTRRGRRVAQRLRAGTVNVNEAYAAAWGSVGAPMGGMGDSGLGRRHGAEGILKYTEAQTVAVQRLLPFAPPFGWSDEQWSRRLTAALRVMKRAGVR